MDGDDLALLKPRDVPPPASPAAARCSAVRPASAARSTTPRSAAWTTFYRRAFDVLTSDKRRRGPRRRKRRPRGCATATAIGSPTHLGDGAPDVERPAPDRPAAGRGRRPLRDRRLRLLGHPRRQLQLRSSEHLPLFDQGISALVEDIYAARPGPATSRWSSGASSAAPRRSTRTPAATTGHR